MARLVEYFVNVGLDTARPRELEGQLLASSIAVVDVAIVNVSRKETAPAGFFLVETTVGGRDAALNGGAVFGDRCYLALRRGQPFRALASVDVVLVDKGEVELPGHVTIVRTASGRAGDLHGHSKPRTVISVRRRRATVDIADIYR